MLSDLLAPFAKAYAVGAGVACSLGQALGMWIGSGSEHQAATGVIDHGKCLRFTTHGFPLFDDWVAVACSSRDRGFYDLPLLKPAGGGAACFGQGHFGVGLSVWLRAGVDQKTAQRIAEDYRPAPGAHLTIGSKRFSLGRVDTYINQPNFDRATRRQLIDGMGWSWKDFKATESYLHAIAGKTATIQYSSPATGPRTTKAHIDGNGECGAG